MLKMTVAAFALAGAAISARASVDTDRANIKSLSGCYEVTFDFAETFAIQKDYVLRQPYHELGLEWVELDVETPSTLSLQHILMTPAGPMKHWREEWNYEATSRYKFIGDATWERETVKAPKGRWLQSVLQVDDSPRYECSAPWIQWGSEKYWECETMAPLPRREYTTRRDYNFLDRRNRVAVTSTGWVMEEDNLKLMVDAAATTPLVKEKGQNQYTRTDDAKCTEARAFWAENKITWHAIQSAWKKIYASHPRLKIKAPPVAPILWEALFEFADDAVTAKKTPAQVELDATTLIGTYLN